MKPHYPLPPTPTPTHLTPTTQPMSVLAYNAVNKSAVFRQQRPYDAEHTNSRSITEVKQHLARLVPDMCQDPKKIRDPGSRGSRIRDLARSWNLHFHFLMGFCRSWILMVFNIEILGILDPADLGSYIAILTFFPGDPGS